MCTPFLRRLVFLGANGPRVHGSSNVQPLYSAALLAVLLSNCVVVAPPPTLDLHSPPLHACLALGPEEQCATMATQWQCQVVHVPSLLGQQLVWPGVQPDDDDDGVTTALLQTISSGGEQSAESYCSLLMRSALFIIFLTGSYYLIEV